jgi:hypothetical protein
MITIIRNRTGRVNSVMMGKNSRGAAHELLAYL